MAETRKKQSKSNQSNGRNITLQEKGEGMRGAITLDEEVVATIAGMCARQIEGIHELGKPRLIPFGNDATRGVDVEVGSKQAAIDLDVVMEYGTDIEACANELRRAMSDEIGKMANREVVEVNIHVSDIHLPEPEEEAKPQPEEQPRVV
jgi:uncharacterized alkaline shock family protein YloU